MKIKFLSTIKKTAYQTVKIAGITLVMLMMAYGIDLTNEAAVSLAADYYYVDAAAAPSQESRVKAVITDYSQRPEVWVNEGGLLKAKVWDGESKNRNNIIQEDNGWVIRYAQNAFVRDGNVQNGDHVYFCGLDCGRISGIGTLHGKYVLFCPDWNNDYGHIMEKGEVYNGVTIQTTGRMFFGRDSELTQECLNQLAAVGVNINAPTQLTTRLYVRDSAYALYITKESMDLLWEAFLHESREDLERVKRETENYYEVDVNRGFTTMSHYDHDYPYSVTADENIFDTNAQEKRQDGFYETNSEKYTWAEEAYRADDADFLRYLDDSSSGFEYYMQKYPEMRGVSVFDRYGLSYYGTSHK